jgi:VRR-NUC domain
MKPESIVQREVRKYLTVLGLTSVAVPNGSHLAGDKLARIKQTAAMKADGMLPGFPDLIVLGSHGRTGYLEVKSPKGRLSQAQQNVTKMLDRMGHQVAVVRSVDETRDALKAWGWLG